MYGQKIYTDVLGSLYVNGVAQIFPYYYPSQANANITVKRNGLQAIITTKDNIRIMLDAQGNKQLCVAVPDCTPFFGKNKLCGLAGNYDGYCANDLVTKNGELAAFQSASCDYGDNKANDWANSWITTDYFYPPGASPTCNKGVNTVGATNCVSGSSGCFGNNVLPIPSIRIPGLPIDSRFRFQSIL